jgi:tetratricopeptide (TPR) repeat protein
MKIIKLIITTFLMILFWSALVPKNAENLMYDIARANRFVLEFQATMTNYSNAVDSDEAQRKRAKLLNVFFSKESNPHCVDLPNRNDFEPMNFDYYLLKIQNYYKNQIETEYSGLQFINCEQVLATGEKVFFFSMVKKIRYNNQERTISQIVEMTEKESSFKIKQIVSKEYFISKNTACVFPEMTKNNDKAAESIDLLEKGDVFYALEDFTNAKSYYESYLKAKGQDATISRRIDSCKLKINTNALLKIADDQFKKGDFYAALQVYQQILTIEPQNQFAQNRLRITETELNKSLYEYNKQKADEYFTKKEFSAALSYYQMAKKYIHNDTYLKGKMIECEQFTNPEYIKQKIKEAKIMAYNGKENEGFRLLEKLEYSGLLDGEAYFILTFVIDDNRVKLNKSEKSRECVMRLEYVLTGIRIDEKNGVISYGDANADEKSKCKFYYYEIMEQGKKNCNKK